MKTKTVTTFGAGGWGTSTELVFDSPEEEKQYKEAQARKERLAKLSHITDFDYQREEMNKHSQYERLGDKIFLEKAKKESEDG